MQVFGSDGRKHLPPPLNDLFANRAILVGSSVSAASQLITATAEPGEPAHESFPAANSVWWTWMPPRSGKAIINLDGSAIVPRVAVYTGDTLATLRQVVAGIGGGTNGSTMVTFAAVLGTAYRIAVDSFFGSVGNIQINVALGSPSVVAPAVDSKGNINFSVEGPAGASYAIDASPDLKTWITIYPGTIPVNGSASFQDAIPPGAQFRFYRVRIL